MKWSGKIGLILSVALASLLLSVAVSASGGTPPDWWNNPQGYSSWRRGAVSETVFVEAYTLIVSITVENTPIPTAHKQVWMQVEWWSDDEGVVVSDVEPPILAWSYDGCDGPWAPALLMPMELAGEYAPDPPSEYQHGREYGAVIEPQPACERIEVTFVDNTPTTPDNSFTIGYSIEVQTLCFDNATSVKIQKLLATSFWPYALALTGIALGGIFITKRRKRAAT